MLNKIILIFGLCFAFGSLGLQRAAAQLVPPPAPPGAFTGQVAHNKSGKASHSGLTPAPAAAADSDETKVVRIYRGTGSFDPAMAERLRPNLVKAFASAKSPAQQTLPGPAVAAGSVPPVPKPTKSDHL